MEPGQRKRRRVQLSCAECHRRKVRCDRNDPCSRCSGAEIRCVYPTDRSDESPSHQLRPPWAVTAEQETFSPIASKRTDNGHKSGSSLKTGVNEIQTTQHEPVDQAVVHGVYSKARLVGTTHPIATYRQCDEMYPINFTRQSDQATDHMCSTLLSEAQAIVASSKATARSLKNYQNPASLELEDAVMSLPSRQICEKLLDRYIQIVELPFRILHIPSFRQQYSAFWDEPTNRQPLFNAIVLLVTAVGVHFVDDMPTESNPRLDAHRWIRAAHAWLSDTQCKGLATIAGLQAQILLVLSLHFNGSKPDRIWITQGSLQRTAVYMGLHRDPIHLPGMSFYHAEMRRRLWNTIMELDLQVSMDLGMLPITIECDTSPPSNLNDEAFEETTPIRPKPTSASIQTQSSLQIILRCSLAVRVTIARIMNDTFTQPSYEAVLKESKALADIVTAHETKLDSYAGIHRNLITIFTRRFLLALHRPFASKALRDPRYHYSRKICLDNALLLLSLENDRDFHQLLLTSVPLFRHVMHHAAIVVCIEIVDQIKEDKPEQKLLHLRRDTRTQLLALIRPVLEITDKRLRMGETNVKSHVFLHMAIAQIEAMEQGKDITSSVLKAAAIAARNALEILQQQHNSISAAVEPGHSHDPSRLELEFMRQNGSVPLTLAEVSDMNVSFGDLASWVFSNSVDEFPL